MPLGPHFTHKLTPNTLAAACFGAPGAYKTIKTPPLICPEGKTRPPKRAAGHIRRPQKPGLYAPPPKKAPSPPPQTRQKSPKGAKCAQKHTKPPVFKFFETFFIKKAILNRTGPGWAPCRGVCRGLLRMDGMC